MGEEVEVGEGKLFRDATVYIPQHTAHREVFSQTKKQTQKVEKRCV